MRAVRLVDLFQARLVEGSAAVAPPSSPRTEWRFDGPPPSPPAAPPPGATPAAPPRPPAPFPATRGWEAGAGIAGLVLRDGRLVGRTTTAVPILRVERTTGLDNGDQLHAVEIRARVSRGGNLYLATRPGPTVDFAFEARQAQRLPWFASTPLVAGDAVQTYTISPPTSVTGARIRHLLIRPTDVAGAEFAIESVRLVFRREHLAGVKSGVSWQGMRYAGWTPSSRAWSSGWRCSGSATARWSRSTPTTARSSTNTGACSTARASTAR